MFAASEVKLRAQKQQPAMRDLEGGDRARCAENGARPGYVRPAACEVVAAVESLYADRLKPFGRILLKRIRELSAAAATAQARETGDACAIVSADAMPLVDPKALRRICETTPQMLRVEPEEGKEYSVLLVGRQRDFVDVTDPTDSYGPEVWSAVAEYFEKLPDAEMVLPGGRYSCAQVLAARGLPFLEGRSLGEVCHIVQIAVSQRRILGYLEGSMVPFGRSVDCIKEQCAVRKQPVLLIPRKGDPNTPLATWEDARGRLAEILSDAATAGRPGVITLSNVKRLFRSRFGLELSETALGYSRLHDLLQDPRLSDLCVVEAQGQQHVVIQRTGAEDPWAAGEPACAESAPGLAAALDPLAVPRAPCAPEPASRRQGLEPWAPAATRTLRVHIQRLLELGEEESREAIRALSEYGSPEGGCRCAPSCPKDDVSRCSSVNVSFCTTSGGSTGQSDLDEEEEDGVDRDPMTKKLRELYLQLAAAASALPTRLSPPPGLGKPL